MPLRGKIAAIVSDSTVLINLGSVKGVRPGMRFRALLETPPIPDPDDPGASLGKLVLEIGTVRVQSVLEKMSYCEVEGTQSFSQMLNFSIGTPILSRFPVDQSEARLLARDALVMKVGTVVELYEEGEKRVSKQAS
jgi:hypothetical protein